MIVNLPVCYRASVPQDWGGLVERRMIRTRVFEIEELGPEDYEISAENLDLGTGDRFIAVWHDGSNWIRETLRTGIGVGETVPGLFDPEDTDQMDLLIRGHAWRSHLDGCQGMSGREAEQVCIRWLNGGRPAASRMAARRTVNSSFDFELERMRRFLSSVRLVDGQLYRRVETPYFRIHPEGWAWIGLGANPDHNGGFRMDRADDVAQHLAELGRTDGRLGCDIPIIHMPEVFAWNDDEVSLDNVTDFIMKFIEYHGKERDTRGRQSANWRFFHAVAEVAEGKRDRSWLAEEMDAFCAVHETAKITSPPMIVRTDELIRLIRPAIVRWNLRPMDIDMGNRCLAP